ASKKKLYFSLAGQGNGSLGLPLQEHKNDTREAIHDMLNKNLSDILVLIVAQIWHLRMALFFLKKIALALAS
ncbi:hypothetical protein ACJX0J_035316, partial [Zea mays]